MYDDNIENDDIIRQYTKDIQKYNSILDSPIGIQAHEYINSMTPEQYNNELKKIDKLSESLKHFKPQNRREIDELKKLISTPFLDAKTIIEERGNALYDFNSIQSEVQKHNNIADTLYNKIVEKAGQISSLEEKIKNINNELKSKKRKRETGGKKKTKRRKTLTRRKTLKKRRKTRRRKGVCKLHGGKSCGCKLF